MPSRDKPTEHSGDRSHAGDREGQGLKRIVGIGNNPTLAGTTEFSEVSENGDKMNLRIAQIVRRYTAIGCTIATTAAGCTVFEFNPESTYSWPHEFADLSIQWTSVKGGDLTTGVAVPVRGYFESRFLAQFTGHLDYTYPGFTDAVEPNEPDDSPDIAARDRMPVPDEATSPRTTIGNIRFHILSTETEGATTTVTVCRYIYSAAESTENDHFTSLVDWGPAETRGITAMRSTMTSVGDVSEPLGPQSGPASAPRTDVFKGWKVTGFLAATGTDYVAKVWPGHEAATQECVQSAPDPLERRAFLTKGEHPRGDFPSASPVPGWPG
ncbi:hypothetical protein [Mycolicibacterium goodii]|uniref:hypothetical protein n=1 Tax=Mycolicibacterium goodii TaxID=134601 RepID=UPI000ADA70FC